ncbi:MAG: thioredoxin domain-containing protein [Actinomycetales bacterium]|nr:thioredoxin domain-containing protein [Actinomycetales bacterium]
MPNRLITATSPYLRDHADNPVDWWPWGEEAFTEARLRDVPILLSIGYAACHWCHVMAHESFEDPLTAAELNAGFVSIKVDREERPDIDAVYMAATTALTGHGGWPMTVVLDHDGRPFYAGTYFPPVPRSGTPSFRQVLAALDQAWRTDRARVLASATAIEEALTAHAADQAAGLPRPRAHLDRALTARAVQTLAAQADTRFGGFGGAPKFPPSMVLAWLFARAGDRQAADLATATAEAMARGGIYDQVGGGFARYSVDAGWVVPHFEKMLYDNALLLRAYDAWWRVADGPAQAMAARVCEETAGFLQRELRTPEGGFASALDADSAPPADPAAAATEGACYVWSPAELAAVLGDVDGAWAATQFHVTEHGTFEDGRSTLQRRTEPDDEVRYARVRARLAVARDHRPRPIRDDKVVLAWNALAVGALARAGAAQGQPSWVTAALVAAAHLRDLHLRPPGPRLHRVSRGGVLGSPMGVLEDYAHLVTAFTHLAGITGQVTWLDTAHEVALTMTGLFSEPGPEDTLRWFDTAHDAERLVRRPQEATDHATPAGPAAAAEALLTLGALTGDPLARDRAYATLAGMGALLAEAPRFAAAGLGVLEALLDGPRVIVVVDRPGGTVLGGRLRTAAAGCPAPGAMVLFADQQTAAAGLFAPLLTGRVGGDVPAPLAYLCRATVCQRPTDDPDTLRAMAVAPVPTPAV